MRIHDLSKFSSCYHENLCYIRGRCGEVVVFTYKRKICYELKVAHIMETTCKGGFIYVWKKRFRARRSNIIG
jgi:hypothetical protein